MKKQFGADYKVKVAIEAIRGLKSPSEIASAFGVHPTQIGFWKRQLIERAPLAFSRERKKESQNRQKLIDELYRIIGEKDTELSWLKKNMPKIDT